MLRKIESTVENVKGFNFMRTTQSGAIVGSVTISVHLKDVNEIEHFCITARFNTEREASGWINGHGIEKGETITVITTDTRIALASRVVDVHGRKVLYINLKLEDIVGLSVDHRRVK